jgi:hypothetical protein
MDCSVSPAFKPDVVVANILTNMTNNINISSTVNINQSLTQSQVNQPQINFPYSFTINLLNVNIGV